jgi:hypothetical protein
VILAGGIVVAMEVDAAARVIVVRPMKCHVKRRENCRAEQVHEGAEHPVTTQQTPPRAQAHRFDYVSRA